LLWIKLFHLCYEWIYDGGQITTKKKKIIRTGYYKRLCLPSPGELENQFMIMMDILNIIRIEENEIAIQRTYG